MSIFKPPKIELPEAPPPPPPPPTPVNANFALTGARGAQERTGFSSLVSTGPRGLKRRASSQRRSLVGTA